MAVELGGFEDFAKEMDKLAAATEDGSRYWTNMAKRVLTEAAQPIEKRAVQNADRIADTGTLSESIETFKPVKHKNGGGFTVRVGVRRRRPPGYYVMNIHKASEVYGAYYAPEVEFGHGADPTGARGPAAPHPFLRPAYDAKKEEAYRKIRDGLELLLFEKRNS